MTAYLVAPLDDAVSAYFIYLMLGLFALALILTALRLERGNTFCRYIPNALTTIGVIGTFTGIYIGLVQFDVHNIDQSVPALLGGMKVAFSTSILGMVLAVFLKVIQTVEFRKTVAHDVTGATFVAALHELIHETKSGNIQISENITALRNAVVGDADSSLVTQIQKFRTSAHDASSDQLKATNSGFESMIAEFKLFAEKVTEDGSEKLIDALNGVIRDFNEKITEQFGENFKHLNEAVGNLLEWQTNHKQQMSELISQINISQKAISQSESSLVSIQNSAKEIPVSMEKIQDIIKITEHQIKNLDENLTSFSEIRDKAVAALPEISTTISKMTTEFSISVDKASQITVDTLSRQSDSLTNALDKSERVFQETVQQYNQSLENLQNEISDLPAALEQSAQSLHNTVEKIGNQLSDEMSQTLADQTGEMRKTITSLQESVVSNMTETNQVIKDSFSTFDHQMQEEIKQTIEAMGSHLASLSNQFVQDYSPLTERLRELVDVSSRARG